VLLLSLNVDLCPGFLQVRENWKMSGTLCSQGKVRGKYFVVKVRENEKLVPPDVRFLG